MIRTLGTTVAVTAVLGASGCSLALMRRSRAGSLPGECTEHKLTVGLDVLAAPLTLVTGGLFVVGASVEPSHDAASNVALGAIALGTIALTVTELVSAGYGNQWANRCRALRPPEPAPPEDPGTTWCFSFMRNDGADADERCALGRAACVQLRRSIEPSVGPINGVTDLGVCEPRAAAAGP